VQGTSPSRGAFPSSAPSPTLPRPTPWNTQIYQHFHRGYHPLALPSPLRPPLPRHAAEEPEECACVEGGIPQLVNSIPLIQCNHLLFLDILAHVYVANAALLFNPIFHVSVSGECGSLEAPQGEEVSLCPGFSCPLGVLGLCCLVLTPFLWFWYVQQDHRTRGD
jgi:hypothetical protein